MKYHFQQSQLFGCYRLKSKKIEDLEHEVVGSLNFFSGMLHKNQFILLVCVKCFSFFFTFFGEPNITQTKL